MKLNNKGFAISGVLYSLLVLFITLFVGILTTLASAKFSFDKIKNDIIKNIESADVPKDELVLDYSTYEINTGAVSTIDYLEGASVLSSGETIETEITYELPSNFSLTTAGTYKITYKALVNDKEITNERTIIVKDAEPVKYDYTGAVQNFSVTQPGTYKLEAWGAQGGYRSSSTYGGKGGYATGIVSLKEADQLFIYVGGAGGNGTSGCGSTICPGGFNGGGYRYKYYGGGGASDIRINTDSLYARVIVAGGGGSDGATGKKGMYGGGSTGGSSTESYSGCSSYCGKGGTQTYSGYSASYTVTTQATTGLTSNSSTNYGGGFGFGGGGVYLSSGYGGAGGGGWYGGSGTAPDGSGDDDRGGGGGSGWIYTESTYTTWANANSSIKANWTLTSDYYLTSASTTNGSASMPNHSSTSNMTGNSGNGVIRITPLFIKHN